MALAYLRQVPAEIAVDMRRGRSISDDSDLRLDTFFFSCLGLAQSAFYITDNAHKAAVRNWRTKVLDQAGRTQFNRMMELRDNDVHHGQSEGQTLGAMMPMERGLGSDDSWMYNQQQRNYAALGISPIATEHKNPDGKTVSSYDGLQGTKSLYVEIAGETCEASTACERFIAQLSSLLGAVEASSVPPLGPLERL